MIRVILLADHANINAQVRKLGRQADYPKLRNVVADPKGGRFLVDSIIYAPLPHSNGDGVHRYHDYLRSEGFQVVSKRGKKLPDGRMKCNLDTELCMDALDLAESIRPDVMIIASGDGDFAPLAIRLRRKGIRVEVASLADSLAGELRLAAQGYIDLSSWANQCKQIGPEAPQVGSIDIFERRLS